MVKNPLANARETGLIPGPGRSLREGNGNLLQYSCLGNPVDRNLVGYSSWGCQESHITERLNNPQFPSLWQKEYTNLGGDRGLSWKELSTCWKHQEDSRDNGAGGPDFKMLTYLEVTPGKELPTWRGTASPSPPSLPTLLSPLAPRHSQPLVRGLGGKEGQPLLEIGNTWEIFKNPVSGSHCQSFWFNWSGVSPGSGCLLCLQIENHCSRKARGDHLSPTEELHWQMLPKRGVGVGLGSHSHVGWTVCAGG